MPTSASPLDAAPPSPQLAGGGPTGQPTAFSLSQLAPQAVPSQQMPPEVLTGIMQSAQSIAQLFDAYAQATPDLAADWAALKDALAATLAKLVSAGAGPLSPTAPGRAFPAAFDRGNPGAGTQ